MQGARQAAGLTQQQLCHQASLSFSTLTKIERGAIKAPSIFTIQAIAGALNVGLDELMGQTVPVRTNRTLLKTKGGAGFIYFDVNGCLVHFYQRAFAKLAEDTGVRSDIIETAYWHYNDDVNRGVMSVGDLNAKLAERLGVEAVNWPDYYLAAVEPVVAMQELLAWAAEHYRIGLMSNIAPGLLAAMRRSGQLPNLAYDAIIDSSEVGAMKPEPKIYEIAQKQAAVPAGEIMLIDDDRGNLMAAEKHGWHVLSFDDARIEESVARAREALEPAED